ncbi:MAG: AAA family ATPase [Planctomycetes bacterium]|nr:AAA family ATPase [Planctomycetota bacterium]
MKVVESAAELRDSFQALEKQCSTAGRPAGTLPIVRASGRKANLPVHVLEREEFWAAFDEGREDRYCCLLGIGDPQENDRCAVEVNTPRQGRSRQFSGLFLRGPDGKVHLGRVGGLSGQEQWRQFLQAWKGEVVEVDGRPVALLGEIGAPELVGSIARFVREFASFRRERAVEPGGNAWRAHLWAILQERAERAGREVVLPLYWKGQRDRRIDGLLVGDEIRVRVTQSMVDRLEQIPADYADGLLHEAHRKHWRWSAEALRSSVNKTVSLNQYGSGLCIPVESPERRTTSLNVYSFFHVDPSAPEVAALLIPEERDTVAGALRERGVDTLPLNQFGHLLHGLTDGLEGDEVLDVTDAVEEEEGPEEVEESVWARHRNVIFFGPPGTGKSYQVQEIVTKHLDARPEHVKRVTFHPEYSYFDFVGSYRPAVGWLRTTATFVDADGVERDREPRTYYRFEPGPFSQALALAARSPAAPVVLVIEEINRGNCAAIFGDVFQLLDRAGDAKAREHEGWSQYGIVPSAEWAAWLEREVTGSPVFDQATRQLRLPGNLYLYATMNTSDQSLFPMDTAFRRRWGMSYMGVDTPRQPNARVRLHAADETGVSWMTLMQTLNRAIVDHARSDDKQMGPWFIRPPVGEVLVDAVEFKSKVLFYLWATVFRDRPARVFRGDVVTYEALLARYDQGRHVFQGDVLAALGRHDAGDEPPDGPAG